MPDQKRDDKQAVERLIEDGLIRYGGGDLAGALAAWERALLQDPGNLQAVGYIDYVRQVFEQLNRPTRDELVVPFGLGHGDAPDYQIEISPEPPDDESEEAVQRGGGLQDGWPISSDDEGDAARRLYVFAEPPGTLDLELSDAEPGAASEAESESELGLDAELGRGRGETLSGARLEDTTDFGDDTPVQELKFPPPAAEAEAAPPTRSSTPTSPMRSRKPTRAADDGSADGDSSDGVVVTRTAAVTRSAELTRAGTRRATRGATGGEDDRDGVGFDGPEQELTPGFLEEASATPGFSEPEPTPGFSDTSGNSTDLRRPDLGFVKARQPTPNTVRRPGAAARLDPSEREDRDAPGAPFAPPLEPPPAATSARLAGASPSASTSAINAIPVAVPADSDPSPVTSTGPTTPMTAVRPGRPELMRFDRNDDRDAGPSRASSTGITDAPTLQRGSRSAISSAVAAQVSRSSKPVIPLPTERQSRPALAAPVEPRRSSAAILPPTSGIPVSPIEQDSGGVSAAEREPTRPRQSVSVLLGANLGAATPVPPQVRPVSGPPGSGGLPGGPLDPWAELAESNSAGVEEYANLEMAPFIEELPPSTEAAEPDGRDARPPSALRPETMTRDLGLAGRYKPRDDLKFGEESPTRELPRPGTEDEEKTQAWATPPGAAPPADALEALCSQILPKLDRDVPPGETRDDRLRRRISTLVELANEWSRLGDPRRAVAAVDLALAEEPDSALAQKLIHRNREAITNIFQGYLGSLERRPSLARSLNALGTSPIGARAAFLLSRVDGHLTYDEILDVSGMPRLEAYRYLCQLLIRGILTVE